MNFDFHDRSSSPSLCEDELQICYNRARLKYIWRDDVFFVFLMRSFTKPEGSHFPFLFVSRSRVSLELLKLFVFTLDTTCYLSHIDHAYRFNIADEGITTRQSVIAMKCQCTFPHDSLMNRQSELSRTSMANPSVTSPNKRSCSLNCLQQPLFNDTPLSDLISVSSAELTNENSNHNVL